MGSSQGQHKKPFTAKGQHLHEEAKEENRIDNMRNTVQNAAASQSDFVGSAIGSREHLDSMQRRKSHSEASQRATSKSR